MPVQPDSLIKGTEVWRVQIENFSELLDPPRLAHGVVTGGGEMQVIIQWDHLNGSTRESRLHVADEVSSDKVDAWRDAADRLTCITDQARHRLSRAAGALATAQFQVQVAGQAAKDGTG